MSYKEQKLNSSLHTESSIQVQKSSAQSCGRVLSDSISYLSDVILLCQISFLIFGAADVLLNYGIICPSVFYP